MEDGAEVAIEPEKDATYGAAASAAQDAVDEEEDDPWKPDSSQVCISISFSARSCPK